MAVDHTAVQIRIRHYRHDAVFLSARLLLARADAPVFGVREAAVRHDRVPQMTLPVEHRVLH